MASGDFDWEKANRQRRVAQNGFQAAEEPHAPREDTPTRLEDRVYGISGDAIKANREDRKKLSGDKARLQKWVAAGDVSPIEVDKLRRRIAALESRLAPEKTKPLKTNKKKRKRKKKPQ